MTSALNSRALELHLMHAALRLLIRVEKTRYITECKYPMHRQKIMDLAIISQDPLCYITCFVRDHP